MREKGAYRNPRSWSRLKAVNFLRESLVDPSKDNKEGSLSTLFDRGGLNRVREFSYRKNN